MMSHHIDPGDAFRRALLTYLIERMEANPDEERRIRNVARAQLELQRRNRLSGDAFQARWEWLLAKSLAELRELLLADTAEAQELRHAHMFAGAIPAAEINRIRAAVISEGS